MFRRTNTHNNPQLADKKVRRLMVTLVANLRQRCTSVLAAWMFADLSRRKADLYPALWSSQYVHSLNDVIRPSTAKIVANTSLLSNRPNNSTKSPLSTNGVSYADIGAASYHVGRPAGDWSSSIFNTMIVIVMIPRTFLKLTDSKLLKNAPTLVWIFKVIGLYPQTQPIIDALF